MIILHFQDSLCSTRCYVLSDLSYLNFSLILNLTDITIENQNKVNKI